MGIGKTIIDMKLKENYQVTILAGKEDGTNSTATRTTATFTTCCESEWVDFISDGVMESRFGFGRRRLAKPACKGKHLHLKSTNKSTSTFYVKMRMNTPRNPPLIIVQKIGKMK